MFAQLRKKLEPSLDLPPEILRKWCSLIFVRAGLILIIPMIAGFISYFFGLRGEEIVFVAFFSLMLSAITVPTIVLVTTIPYKYWHLISRYRDRRITYYHCPSCHARQIDEKDDNHAQSNRQSKRWGHAQYSDQK